MNCRSRIITSSLTVVATAVLAMAMAGCSTSSSSISDSVSSPFKWSSDSSTSSSGGQEAAYQRDVRDYVCVYLPAFSDMDTFRNGLATIAAKYGVSNWEADQATFIGVGEGLAKVQASEQQLAIFKSGLAQGDSAKIAALMKGYENYRNRV